MTTETHCANRAGYPPMMVHKFTIGTERKTARDVAECGPYRETSSRSCAARKLARVLVEVGEADGPVLAYGPDGALRYRANSLYAFARFTLAENPRSHLTRHQAIPQGTFSRTAGSDAPDVLTDPIVVCGASGAGETP